jgi:hypothetical protein
MGMKHDLLAGALAVVLVAIVGAFVFGVGEVIR